MNRDRRSSSNDPSDELVSDQSSSTASGQSTGRSAPGAERDRNVDDVVNRDEADVATPRRYEQPIDDDTDAVMPSDDATLNTKI